MADEKENNAKFESELEDFVRENREVLEKLLEKVKENECREGFSELKDRTKSKFDEKMKETLLFVTNPEMQSHFMTAGFQFMMGINAAIRALPLPEFVKESVESVEKAREQTAQNMCKANPECRFKPKEKPKSGRIEINVTEESETPEPETKPRTSRTRKKVAEE